MNINILKYKCYLNIINVLKGQKCFFLHMMVLPLIPITALVIQNSVTMHTILSYQGRVETIRAQVNKNERLSRLIKFLCKAYPIAHFLSIQLMAFWYRSEEQWKSPCSSKISRKKEARWHFTFSVNSHSVIYHLGI